MIIDAHHHLELADDYVEKLIAECDRIGIDKVCLFGAGYADSYAGNDGVIKAVKQYPNRIVGFGCFALGIDLPNKIEEFIHNGLKGVKFINPRKNYDDKEYYNVYGRMEYYKMPALFHLGIVAHHPSDKYYDIDNGRHRPIYLDTIARAFPDLKIIGAHFGNPWCEEAAMVARWNPNVYFDLTGSLLKCKSAKFLGELLYWTPTSRYKGADGRHAWEKIIFGSDVSYCEISDVLNDYHILMSELNIPLAIQQKVLGGTMAEILMQ